MNFADGHGRNRFPLLTAEEILDRAGRIDVQISRQDGRTVMHFMILSATGDDECGGCECDGGKAGMERRPVEVDGEFLKRLIEAFGA